MNEIVKALYGLDEYYGDECCCLTCDRPQKKVGCLCVDMKCKKCIFYVSKELSTNYKKAHCGYGHIENGGR